MKVAYVTPYYNGACDGRYGRFHDWVHALRDSEAAPFDFEVHAFASSNEDHTLSSTSHSFFGDAVDLWDSKINKMEYTLNARRVHHDLRNGDFDLVHVLVMDLIIYPTVLSAVDVPIVVGPDISGWSPLRRGTFWGTGLSARIKKHTGYHLRKRLASHHAFDHVVAFSRHHQRILLEIGIPSQDITILRPGVSSKFFPKQMPISDPPELLYVGDFSEHKGYPIFLQSLSELDINFTARIIGAGDARWDLIDSLGLNDRVMVEGFVPRVQLPDYYRGAEIFINPSIDEMGPNTQIEALACGVPIVATDRLGTNEYAPENAAVYFWPRTSEQLANAIEIAVSNLDTMASSARERAKDFDVSHTVNQLQTIYSRVLN